ncbi:hypothetical protein B0H17DRAFT_1270739 [Mycena rosella]|uniref:Uncharacterized protein n=1 Tax=Mycena rosella TaxID=1033263 RepID=A0AAD7CHN3_MYCRO|nr:hypothetical protein B0H17DRAFT_1270739 [Mycena rosella]
MGGTLFALSPSQSPDDKDVVYVPYSYRGFEEIKVVLLHATIAYLTALSGKEISKALLIEEGILTLDSVEGIEEQVVIVNCRTRIDAAIPIVQSWLRTPGPELTDEDAFAKFLGLRPGTTLQPWQKQLIATPTISNKVALLGEIEKLRIDCAKLEALTGAPRSLVELKLAGIYILTKFADNNDNMPYANAKDVAQMLRKVKPHCVWSEDWEVNKVGEKREPEDGEEGEPEDDEEEYDDEPEVHIIDQLIGVFEAVPPEGSLCN